MRQAFKAKEKCMYRHKSLRHKLIMKKYKHFYKSIAKMYTEE